MDNTVTIALDAMGGDFGPSVVIPGAARFLKGHKNLHFLIYGDEAQINIYLNKYPDLAAASKVIHTDKYVENHDKPSSALRKSKGTSMRMAIESVNTGDAGAVVSAGNTGALMAMAKLILRPLEGIHRPAIASIIPAPEGDTIMMDMGANLLVEAENLVQFALLGSLFAKAHKGASIDKPTVGILNIGSEDSKGPDHVKGAAELLSTITFPGIYTGYVEGNDILNGPADVIVTDGYAGNIALKTMEGTAKSVGRMLKNALKSDPLAMLGSLLAFFAFSRFKKKADPRLYNGGVFLGLNGLCVKSHGGTDHIGFASAIKLAYQLANAGYIDQVRFEIEKLMEQESLID